MLALYDVVSFAYKCVNDLKCAIAMARPVFDEICDDIAVNIWPFAEGALRAARRVLRQRSRLEVAECGFESEHPRYLTASPRRSILMTRK